MRRWVPVAVASSLPICVTVGVATRRAVPVGHSIGNASRRPVDRRVDGLVDRPVVRPSCPVTRRGRRPREHARELLDGAADGGQGIPDLVRQ